MKRSELLATVVQIPLDYAVLYGAFLLAYQVRNTYFLPTPEDLGGIAERFNYIGADLLPLTRYLHYVNVLVPIMVLGAMLVGAYAIRQNQSWWQRLVQVVMSVSVAELLVVLLFLLRGTFFLPRSTILLSWVFGIAGMILVRILVVGGQKLLRRYAGIGVQQIWLVGEKKELTEINRYLRVTRWSSYSVARKFTDATEAIAALEQCHQTGLGKPDLLLVCADHVPHDQMMQMRNRILDIGREFAVLPPFLTNLPAVFSVSSLGDLPLVRVQPSRLEGWYLLIKRGYDILASLVLLLVFSPIFLVSMLAIKFAGKGPIFYRDVRLGIDGKKIGVWKFCTFYPQYNGEAGNVFLEEYLTKHPELREQWDKYQKLPKDPRVTPIGKFLRSSSMDELPQLWSVLLGDLSLVGPRPILPSQQRQYGELYRVLFTVRPGLTGLWQVSGRNNLTFQDRARLDAHYIEHWSLALDISITVRTAGQVVRSLLGRRGGGAY